MRAPRALLPCAAVALLALVSRLGSSWAEDPPAPEEVREVPVRVTAEVDAREAGEMALWRVKLAFQAEEAPARPYRVVLHLVYQGQTWLDLSHAPRTAVATWKKGQKVAYEVPVPVPTERGLRPGAELELRLGFLDPATEKVLPFLSEESPRAGLITLCAGARA